MSDHFQHKSYGDYFKALEEKMNNPSGKEPVLRKEATSRKIATHRKKRKGFYRVIRLRKSFIAVFAAVVLVIAGSAVITSFTGADTKADTADSRRNGTVAVAEKKEEIAKISYTFTDQTVDIPSANDAKYAVVIDKSTNTVIAARNPHERTYPASTTKIMTLLVAVENITDMNDTFTMTYAITDPLYVRDASVAGFLNGEVISMTDLLYGLILPSGADAAVGLAVKLAGSEEAFVELMNEKALELGLQNTHFANVSGLYDENNYSSAYDMAVILDSALQNELCKTILSTKKYTTAKTEQNPEGLPLSSTLFDYMYGTEPETATILGGKTGYISQSGYCIASYGTGHESGNRYIVVTMNNSSRWPAFHGQIDLYKEFAK